MFAPKLYACGVPHAAIIAALNYKNANIDDRKTRVLSINSKGNNKCNKTTNATHDNGWLPVAMNGPFQFEVHGGKAKLKKNSVFLTSAR